jgi:hypothetical protein
VISAVCSYTAIPTCTSCDTWTTCSNGSQTCTSKLPAGCTGGTFPTTRTCNEISLSEFKDPLANLPSEQCLWCASYYDSNGTLKAGKEGNDLDFSFKYGDNTTKKISSYEFILTADNVTDPSLATNKIHLRITGLASNPGTTIKLSGFSTVNRGTLNASTKTIPYDGKTYNWWVKVTNSSNESSEWIKSDTPFKVSDHKWPKPGMVSSTIQVNSPTQFCSTAISNTDPCINLCWVKAGTGVTNMEFSFGNPTLQKLQLASSSWKCSVCYDTAGNEMLCQDAPKSGRASNFGWDVADPAATGSYTPVFPANTTNSTWWRYGSSYNNGREAFNPAIQFKVKPSTSARVKLNVYGSDCPLAAAPISQTIRPIWVEN